MDHARSWLCPEPGDRERLLDMDARLRKARAIALGFLTVALLAAGPWVGFWTVFVLLTVAIGFQITERLVRTAAKPEWPIAAGWLLSSVAIALSVVLTGGPDSPAKSWLLIPAATLPARFGGRGLIAGTAITYAFLLLVTVGVDAGAVADEPQLLIFPAGLIAATLALSMALRSAEIHHRAESVIDQLTGMLNRKALEARASELEQQASVAGQPVGLILCDVDHFKTVNDTHGHAVGDAVLKDIAYRIRKELRAYDLAYRLGGEEFAVLVPGASLTEAEEVAERLRAAVGQSDINGYEVTISLGAAVSPAGPLDFEDLYERADEALYAAKREGRDRVRVAGLEPVLA